MCSAIAIGTGKSPGSAGKRRVSAWGPPVDVPITTSSIRNDASAGTAALAAGVRGAVVAGFAGSRGLAAAAARTLLTSSAESS